MEHLKMAIATIETQLDEVRNELSSWKNNRHQRWRHHGMTSLTSRKHS
jgi:hypothetical protein